LPWIKRPCSREWGGLIVTTVATSSAIYDIAEYNGESELPEWVSLLVARELKIENELFGGETVDNLS
jgi:phosphomannomutase/phosphoglucomutase